jgi:hypothetical protein
MMKNLRNGRAIFRVIASAFAAVASWCLLLFLMCGPLPTDIGKNAFPVQLTLEAGALTTATFSGPPIIATVTLPDSDYFDNIAWHLGRGSYRHIGISPVQKIKQVQVELFWTSIPLCKDTTTKQSYDTVYVSTHGESVRSNTVKVIVTNVPPVIDSVKAGPSAASTSDTVRYSIPLNDTSSFISLKVTAHDPNAGDILKYDWFSTRGVALSTTAIVSYAIPKSQFVDTVFVTVYDDNGGSASKMIIMSKLASGGLPVIDSISVGARVFAQDTTFHVYGALQLDTLKFRVYAHDSDVGVTLTYAWTKKNARDTLVSPASLPLATMVCDAIYRKVNDTLRTADTVAVVVRDGRGDSAMATVRLVQGHVNTAPKIDSIGVNGVTQCKGASATTARDTVFAWAKSAFMFRIFTTDPDSGDTVKLGVSAGRTSLITKLSDSAAQYVCKDSAYTDTVVFRVKDLAGDSAVKKIVISVVNRPPVLDSIRVNGVTQCKGVLALSRDTAIASAGTVFSFRVFDHDTDFGDTVRLSVASKQPSCLVKVSDTSAQYTCKDSAYTDTIVFDVKDVTGDSAVKRIVVSVVDHPPLLDSIRVDNLVQCKGAVAMFRDTAIASASDTVRLRIFASDPDAGDTVRLSVSANQGSSIVKLSDTSAQYVCKDSVYADTVICTVRDLAGYSAVKKIVIAVLDHAPAIDSIRVNGVTQCKGLALSSVCNASGTDTVTLRPYASDPDKGDKVTVGMSSKLASALTVLSDTAAQYVCKDSLYSDTVVCIAKDLLGGSVKKSVIISVINRLPVCDSIWVADSVNHDTLSFPATDSLVSGHAAVGLLDSVKVKLFAHDPDAASKDSIAQVQWTLTSGRAVKALDAKGLYIKYPAPAASGTDTVSVKITDTKQKSAKMSLIFDIK